MTSYTGDVQDGLFQRNFGKGIIVLCFSIMYERGVENSVILPVKL